MRTFCKAKCDVFFFNKAFFLLEKTKLFCFLFRFWLFLLLHLTKSTQTFYLPKYSLASVRCDVFMYILFHKIPAFCLQNASKTKPTKCHLLCQNKGVKTWTLSKHRFFTFYETKCVLCCTFCFTKCTAKQNIEPLVKNVMADCGTRTRDIKLGRLAFYHWTKSALMLYIISNYF